MSTPALKDHITLRREERIAREKARIEKLRELNLKKYGPSERIPSATQTPRMPSMSSISVKHSTLQQYTNDVPKNLPNGNFKRPTTAPIPDAKNLIRKDVPSKTVTNLTNKLDIIKKPTETKHVKKPTFTDNRPDALKKAGKPLVFKVNKATETKSIELVDAAAVDNKKKLKLEINIPHTLTSKHAKGDSTLIKSNRSVTEPKVVRKSVVPKELPKSARPKTVETLKKSLVPPAEGSRKSMMPPVECAKKIIVPPENTRKSMIPSASARKSFVPPADCAKKVTTDSRKSMIPTTSQNGTKVNTKRQSVFERLYQPKVQPKKNLSDTEKLMSDPNFYKRIVKNTGLILNKRHTCFEKKKKSPPVRRSISAVHFRRINKSELANCVQKWSSIGEDLDRSHLKDVTEDALVKQDLIVSAVKSERKKVKFLTPVPYNYNTPGPKELQERLQNWLKKRGKSMDSYHHLQCFGLHHLTEKEIKPLNVDVAEEILDDEDKENQPLDSDSDNDSYHEAMNNKCEEIDDDINKWRTVSCVSDSVDFNETRNTTLTSTETHHHVDELLHGALSDLTELLREGFDWEQSARWLRAIRERFPYATDSAAYWECRAALEERRGDLPASVECWQECIVKGTDRSVVEANLDQLLDKFMQLKISPTSGKKKRPDPKMVDVKNVFKSTLIRFAVQQAKIRKPQDSAKYTVTPVRRSGRLSAHWSGKKRTPLQVVSSVKQAGLLGHPLVFVPNDKLVETP